MAKVQHFNYLHPKGALPITKQPAINPNIDRINERVSSKPINTYSDLSPTSNRGVNLRYYPRKVTPQLRMLEGNIEYLVSMSHTRCVHTFIVVNI